LDRQKHVRQIYQQKMSTFYYADFSGFILVKFKKLGFSATLSALPNDPRTQENLPAYIHTVTWSHYPYNPDWNLSTFSTRSRLCNKKNQACKWTSRATAIACSAQY